jgi:hypothetical protein
MMSLVYALMIGVLEHYGEAVRLDRCHEGLCARPMIADGLEESLNLTL